MGLEAGLMYTCTAIVVCRKIRGWGYPYPFESSVFIASLFPFHAAQCTAVHPSPSSLLTSLFAAFLSRDMLPSFAAWCNANKVGVSAIFHRMKKVSGYSYRLTTLLTTPIDTVFSLFVRSFVSNSLPVI